MSLSAFCPFSSFWPKGYDVNKQSYQPSRRVPVTLCLKCILKFAFTSLIIKILFRSSHFCEKFLVFLKIEIGSTALTVFALILESNLYIGK